jgi:hypothetical protein
MEGILKFYPEGSIIWKGKHDTRDNYCFIKVVNRESGCSIPKECYEYLHKIGLGEFTHEGRSWPYTLSKGWSTMVDSLDGIEVVPPFHINNDTLIHMLLDEED